jgi:hypothetical protein
MDVDLAFHTNTTHSWGIHGNDNKKNANKRRTRQSQPQEKEKKTFNSFFTTVSAITVNAARRIVQEWQYVKHQQKSRRRQRNKKSLMKKLRQSWMCCTMHAIILVINFFKNNALEALESPIVMKTSK